MFNFLIVGIWRRMQTWFVKLFDAWGGRRPLKETNQAEKTAVPDDRNDGQGVRGIAERIAINEYEICQGSRGNSADLVVEPEDHGRATAGCLQYLVTSQACLGERP